MIAVSLASSPGPIVARRAARIRPFVSADIPQVVRVHRAAFRAGGVPDFGSYREYFTRVFLENSAHNPMISSLVHEEHDGLITGFVGLVPRRVVVNGRQYQAVVSSQFIVDPASQVGLVAVRLAKAYLDGPQDLSIADEANDVSRKIWEGLGGVTALLLSMYWTRPLRPVELMTSCLGQRRGLAAIAAAGRPLAMMADALAVRMPGSQLRLVKSSTSTEELSAHAVVSRASEFCDRAALRAEYDERTFQWLVERAARRSAGGRLIKAVVKNGSAVLGWYIAHLDGDGVADVAQVAATPASIDAVLDRLFFDAWRHGAVSVTGRLDPRFMQALSDKYCLFHRRGPWMLIKSNKPELLDALQSGATGLSRLDGEWSLRYQP